MHPTLLKCVSKTTDYENILFYNWTRTKKNETEQVPGEAPEVFAGVVIIAGVLCGGCLVGVEGVPGGFAFREPTDLLGLSYRSSRDFVL